MATFLFDLEPAIATLTITDTNTVDGSKGLVQILSPDGLTIYQNPGYAAGNYASPDFVYGTTETITKALTGALVNGNPEPGDYTVNIKRNSGNTFNNYPINYVPKVVVPIFSTIENAGVTPSSLTITDDSDYGDPLGVALSRNWTITFPLGCLETPVTGTTKTIVAGPMYGGGAYTYGLVVEAMWAIAGSGGYYPYRIHDVLTFSKPYVVQSYTTMCEALCIVKEVQTKLTSAQGTNDEAYWQQMFNNVSSIPQLMQQAYCCGQNTWAVSLAQYLKTVANLGSGCGCGCGGGTPETPVLVQYGCDCDCGGGSTYDPGIGAWTAITSFDTGFSNLVANINAAVSGRDYAPVKWRVEKEYVLNAVTYQTIHIVGCIAYTNPEDSTIFPANKRSCFTPTSLPSAYHPANTVASFAVVFGDDLPYVMQSFFVTTDGKGYTCLRSAMTNGVTDVGYGVYVDFTYDIVKA